MRSANPPGDPGLQCAAPGALMAGVLTAWSFRYRGKTARILAIVDCFRKEPTKGLSPAQIGRASGVAMYDTVRILDQIPELFVKLPGRGDGITRYRLASSVAARGEGGVEDLVARNAQRESWIYYGLLTTALLLALVALLAVVPPLL